ncbi:type IV pilus modification PilV family protein [Amphritea sp.]|uniref:type IV pilus modification PilV family protein n=1 Tax=Amphritea sp. TaxID=1872502 RepID=UPI003A912AA0
MKNIRNIHSQQGIAMLELVIAVLILAFGVIALGAMQNKTMGKSTYSKAMAEGLVIAEQKLEEMRNFATLSDYNSGIVTGSSSVTGTNAIYTDNWVVTNHTAPDYKTIEMTVSWEDRFGAQSVQLSSIVAQDDPVEAGKLLFSLSGSPPSSSSGGSTDDGDDTTSDDNADDSDDTPTDDNTGGSNDDGETEESDDNSNDSDYSLIISGSVAIMSNGVKFNGVSGSGNYAVSCTNTSSYYACYVGSIDAGDTWTGNITVSTNQTVCSPADNPKTYTAISSDQTQNYTLGKRKDCP